MSDNWTVQISPKLPDGTLVNIRAEDEATLVQAIETVVNNAQSITDVITLLSGSLAVSTGGLTSTTPVSETSPGRTCKHGSRVRRTGTNSKGPWVGWYCPTDRGATDKCSTEFE